MLTNAFRSKHVAPISSRCFQRQFCHAVVLRRRSLISEGRATTPADEPAIKVFHKSPFHFEVGYSIFAKRASRPFPPPFVSRPSGSFSDPLTTHDRIKHRYPKIDGETLRGITNGDDAIIIGGDNFIAVNDGVGAWAQKDRGHAALWSRLIAHYWATEYETALKIADQESLRLEDLNPIGYLETAYDRTKTAAALPKDGILGTTTASSVILHHKSKDEPVVLATTLGDCAIFVIRPSKEKVIYKSKEQWHWFDCPRQLGTNSPDTPKGNAVTDIVDVQEDDVVVVVSDGVTDNLWEHEICTTVCDAVNKWRADEQVATDGIVYVARVLMNAAREVAEDTEAESPYMERAFDEGLAAEGGKLDDISVVIGLCKRREE